MQVLCTKCMSIASESVILRNELSFQTITSMFLRLFNISSFAKGFHLSDTTSFRKVFGMNTFLSLDGKKIFNITSFR